MILVHDSSPLRIDLAIAGAETGISRRGAKRLLDESRVVVNGVPVGQASREVRRGDRIAIIGDEPAIAFLELTAERAVIDKPPGFATQLPRRNGPLSVVEILAARLRQRSEPPALWVVHRLDTGTSGVLIFARAQREAARLSALFAAHEWEKSYVARLRGRLDRELVLDEPIARSGPVSFAQSAEGLSASTRVRPIAADDQTTLAHIEISTGRTHQIRVHLASAGFPVVGDLKYGGGASSRLMLHAWKLAHPKVGGYEAEIPAVISDGFAL
ncbi:MAG TPA: RluA family pseudouridine synthase [Thermoanaerobaculia bacterium]|nr:RluA family pseudouridine synthase [Thermoanaerobaculia bacterium]